MKGTRAAQRYAKATLSLAGSDKAQQIGDDMQIIKASIDKNKDLKLFLNSPVIDNKVKHQSLLAIFSQANTLTKDLFHLLCQNGRFSLLFEVANQYQILLDQLNNVERATVYTAVELTDSLKEKVVEKAKEFTNKTLIISNKVEPSIIGGFILKIGDLQYNGSVANKLNELKQSFSIN